MEKWPNWVRKTRKLPTKQVHGIFAFSECNSIRPTVHILNSDKILKYWEKSQTFNIQYVGIHIQYFVAEMVAALLLPRSSSSKYNKLPRGM